MSVALSLRRARWWRWCGRTFGARHQVADERGVALIAEAPLYYLADLRVLLEGEERRGGREALLHVGEGLQHNVGQEEVVRTEAAVGSAAVARAQEARAAEEPRTGLPSEAALPVKSR